MRIYQLEGEASDLALLIVPDGIDCKEVQRLVDIAFDAFSESEYVLTDALEWLEEIHNLKRVYIQDHVFTNRL